MRSIITIEKKHPCSFFSTEKLYQEWVIQNDGKGLWAFLSPKSNVEQEILCFQSDDVFSACLAFSVHTVTIDTVASIRFHINAIIVDRKKRDRTLSNDILRVFLDYSKSMREKLFLDGYFTIHAEIDCIPTARMANSFCERLTFKFNEELEL